MNTTYRCSWLFAVVFLVPTVVVSGNLGGKIYLDQNRNGLMDQDELPLANVPIHLLGEGGADLRFTLTDADGQFLFSDLADGHYAVSIREADDFRHTLPDQGADAPPVLGFPFGRPRYATMPGLVANLVGAAAGGIPFRHVGLGDSIGFGFNLCDSPFGANGYIAPTTARLAGATSGVLFADNQAVLGRETADLLIPGVDPDATNKHNDIFYVKDTGAPLVSISIGGNDFLAVEDAGDAAIAAKLVSARQNLQEVLSTLVSEIPYANVTINTVYDNLEGSDPLHNTWVPIWNQMLRETAWAQARRVTIAEIYPEYAHYEDAGILGQTGLICHWLGLDEIHPTKTGYDVHEEKLWQAWGGVTLANGESRTDFNIGFLRVAGRLTPTNFDDVNDNTAQPELVLLGDGQGALIPSHNAELRVFGFNPVLPPNRVLAQALVKVRYRTTGAPLDDYYRFEVSLDGSFAEPGDGPSDWNSIIPIVGASGNGGSRRLAYSDQPNYRVVSAPLYQGAPTSGAGTLELSDLGSLQVRLVTTSVGSPDAFDVEWDTVILEGFTMPAPGAQASKDTPTVRDLISSALEAGEDPDTALVAGLQGQLQKGDADLLLSLVQADAPMLRATSLRLLSQVPGFDPVQPIMLAMEDQDAVVRRTAARAAIKLPAVQRRDLLIILAADIDASVRRVAVSGLAQMRDNENVPQLTSAMNGDRSLDVRIEAAAGLLALGDPTGVDVLLDGLVQTSPSSRARDVLTRYPDIYQPLIDNLDDAVPERCAWAARFLGLAAPLPEAIRIKLRGLLNEGHPGVRIAVADALSRSGDLTALPSLIALASDPLLQTDMVTVLGRYWDSRALQALFSLASSSSANETARLMAARQLALQSTPAAVPLLEGLLKSDNQRVARLAKSGLRR